MQNNKEYPDQITITKESVIARKREREYCTYFISKASILICKLISGQGTVKERLLDCEYDIGYILTLEIPKDFFAKRKKIKANLYKKEEIKAGKKIKVTSFRNTLKHMRKKRASQIVLDIYNLYLGVTQFSDWQHQKINIKYIVK